MVKLFEDNVNGKRFGEQAVCKVSEHPKPRFSSRYFANHRGLVDLAILNRWNNKAVDQIKNGIMIVDLSSRDDDHL
jgi:hypothetical protein